MDERNQTYKEGTKDNTVAIYTAVRILKSIRVQLGLEAMLEYLDGYARTVESSNPQVEHAVSRALTLVDIQKLYLDFAKHEKN